MQRNIDADNQSLRGFLRLVESDHPEELLRVRQPIDLRFDATALQTLDLKGWDGIALAVVV